MPYTPPADTRTSIAASSTPVEFPSPEPSLVTESRNPRQELQVRLTAQRILKNHLRAPVGKDLAELFRLQAERDLTFWPDIDLDLTGAHLVDWDLSQCRVRSLTANNAVFSGDAWFDEATFSGKVGFEQATFSGDVWFEQATFSGRTGFEQATFSGEARFREATFSEVARFEQATFSGLVGFGEATFSSVVAFKKVMFSGDTDFGEATFCWTAEFEGATFSGDVWFEKATFAGIAGFKEATFSGDVLFQKAEFVRAPVLADSRVRLGDEHHRIWPAGWTVAASNAGQEFGGLVHS
jgi:uncharacterized protein YjbI with pentapeptide repeats